MCSTYESDKLSRGIFSRENVKSAHQFLAPVMVYIVPRATPVLLETLLGPETCAIHGSFTTGTH